MADEKKEEVEEAEVNAYMEAELNGDLTDDDRKEFLTLRLDKIKAEYRGLRMLKEEYEKTKNPDALNQLSGDFRKNFLVRRYCVTELRRLGDKVEDQFVPDSKR